MAKTEVAAHGIDEHNTAWGGFVKGCVAVCLMCAFVVVALCEFGFGTSYTFLIGFGGMIVGMIAIIIDARANPSKWYLSTALLIAYGLLVAVAIT